MTKERFIQLLREAITDFAPAISCADGSWAVKGFIDIHKTIYTISTDTKIVSKILELYIFPKILDFANRNELEIELTKETEFLSRHHFQGQERQSVCRRFEEQLSEDGNSYQRYDIGSVHRVFPRPEKLEEHHSSV